MANPLSKVCSSIFSSPLNFMKYHALFLSFFTKCFLIYYYRSWTRQIVWLPSFFIPDILITSIGALILYLINKILNSPIIKNLTLTFTLFVFNIILMLVNTLCMSSIYRIGKFLYYLRFHFKLVNFYVYYRYSS